jgi:hypothetical protein
MTDRPCVSMGIDYEKVIEESSSKGKERWKTRPRSKETRRLVTGARCELELLVDVETKGGRGRRGAHI